MSMKYLTEAFKEIELLESEQFTFDDSGVNKLQQFLDADIDVEFQPVIDAEAKTEDELQPTYIGTVIGQCPVCKSTQFLNIDTIVIDEETQYANVGICCPYCFDTTGVKIIGQVAGFDQTSVEVDGADADVKVAVDGEVVTTNNTESEKNIKVTARHAKDNEDLEDSQRYPVEGTKQVDLTESRTEKLKHLRDKLAKRHAKDNEDLEDSQRYPIESPAPAQTGTAMMEGKEVVTEETAWDKIAKAHPELIKTEPLKEGMEDISITTDDTVIKVKATPRNDIEAIQPVSDETKAAIESEETTESDAVTETTDEVTDVQTTEEVSTEETTPETDVDVEFDDFDEESFSTLGEAYLKRVYENVESFKVTDGKLTSDEMLLEGVITFTSGNTAKTQFKFVGEAKQGDHFRFKGLNEHLSNYKKPYTLVGKLRENKLCFESLNYNYSVRNSEGKLKGVYGTVRTR